MEQNLSSTQNTTSSEIIKEHYLYPASLHVFRERGLISTILGSCVAVCLYDVSLRIGGMNHYMLPLWNGEGLASPKFGNIAIERLYDRMMYLGCERKNLKSKVFGGGEVVDAMSTHFNIGQRNIEVAMRMLDSYSIPVIASNVAGTQGRKIVFDTGSGDVRMKFIAKNTPVPTIPSFGSQRE